MAAKKAGDALTFTIFRENALREVRVTVARAPVPEYRLEKVADPAPLQKSIYESWLGGKWE